MKIAIDVRSLMEGRFSGVEQYTMQIIRGLLRVAPREEYHLFYNAAKEVLLPDFYGDVAVHGFRYPNKLFNVSQWLFSYPKWDELVPADVVFVPNSRLVPIKVQTPLVVVAHDLSFEKFPEFLDSRRRIWHVMMNPRHLMKRADHIIAVSEHTKHDVMSLYGIPEERITVIHSGIAHQGMPAQKDIQRVREKYQLPKKFVLYIGAHEPRKNIPTLVRAWRAIAGSIPQDLVLAGERGWRRGQLSKTLAQGQSQDRVHELGFIPELDKAALYAAADLFVYPSFYEGFGFPPLEALMAGTPVVTSFNSALSEVVGEWATMIDPYNGGELAGVMKELLSDLPEVTEKTQQEIRERYSWDTAALQTLRVLEEVK